MMLYVKACKKWMQTYSEGYIFIVRPTHAASALQRMQWSLAQSFKNHQILIKAIHATGMPAYENDSYNFSP